MLSYICVVNTKEYCIYLKDTRLQKALKNNRTCKASPSPTLSFSVDTHITLRRYIKFSEYTIPCTKIFKIILFLA